MSRRAYGTGSVFERTDSKGAVSYYGKWRVDGRQVKRRIGPKRMHGRADGLTRAAAEARLRELIAEHAAEAGGTERRGSAQTFAELALRYDLDRGRRLKARTRADYSGYMRHHIGPYFNDRAIRRLDRDDVALFVSHLERRGLAPKTIANVVLYVSSLLNYAVDRGWLARNVAKGVNLPEPEEAGAEELRFLEPYEVNDLLAVAGGGVYGHVDRAMYATAAMAGLRTGELLALRWESVDLDNGRLRVVRAFSRMKVSSTKGRRQRSVPMAPQVADALIALRDVSRFTRPDELVLGDPRSGARLADASRYRRWTAAKQAAGIDPTFVFHDLRHTFGTTCARNGVPLATIALWMGHQSTRTTEIYAMHAPAHQDGARLGAFFTGSDPRAVGTPGTNLPAPSVPERTSDDLRAA